MILTEKIDGEWIMFDDETGEIMEYYTIPYKHSDVEYQDVYDKTKVTCKQDIEEYFKDEFYNEKIKNRWTNWALKELLTHGYSLANNFSLLSDLIIARNIVFEKTDKICDCLGINKKNFGRVLKEMQDAGLVREFKEHSGTKSWRYLELNPTLVFKTYQQSSSGESSQEKYGSSSVFNPIHKRYIEKWLEESYTSSPYDLVETDSPIHHNHGK